MKNKYSLIEFPDRITDRQLLIILLSEQAVLRAHIQLIENLLRKSSGVGAAALDKQLAALIKASGADLDRRLKEYDRPA
jgi:hypothetical protein